MRNAILQWLMQSKVLATIIAHTFVMGLVIIGLLLYSWLFGLPSFAAQAAPVDVAICEHIATANSIKVFYCEDINLFVNQLGFMVPAP